MIVGASDEYLSPWLVVRRLDSGTCHEPFDARGGERLQSVVRGIAQTCMVSSIDALEVTEDQRQFLKMERRQLLVRAVERVSDSMGE
jgi:hypothetical protein